MTANVSLPVHAIDSELGLREEGRLSSQAVLAQIAGVVINDHSRSRWKPLKEQLECRAGAFETLQNAESKANTVRTEAREDARGKPGTPLDVRLARGVALVFPGLTVVTERSNAWMIRHEDQILLVWEALDDLPMARVGAPAGETGQLNQSRQQWAETCWKFLPLAPPGKLEKRSPKLLEQSLACRTHLFRVRYTF